MDLLLFLSPESVEMLHCKETYEMVKGLVVDRKLSYEAFVDVLKKLPEAAGQQHMNYKQVLSFGEIREWPTDNIPYVFTDNPFNSRWTRLRGRTQFQKGNTRRIIPSVGELKAGLAQNTAHIVRGYTAAGAYGKVHTLVVFNGVLCALKSTQDFGDDFYELVTQVYLSERLNRAKYRHINVPKVMFTQTKTHPDESKTADVCMTRCQGSSLRDIARGANPNGEIFVAVAHVCKALWTLQEDFHFVHGDLNDSNVYFDAAKHDVTFIDFGMSCVNPDQKSLSWQSGDESFFSKDTGTAAAECTNRSIDACTLIGILAGPPRPWFVEEHRRMKIEAKKAVDTSDNAAAKQHLVEATSDHQLFTDIGKPDWKPGNLLSPRDRHHWWLYNMMEFPLEEWYPERVIARLLKHIDLNHWAKLRFKWTKTFDKLMPKNARIEIVSGPRRGQRGILLKLHKTNQLKLSIQGARVEVLTSNCAQKYVEDAALTAAEQTLRDNVVAPKTFTTEQKEEATRALLAAIEEDNMEKLERALDNGAYVNGTPSHGEWHRKRPIWAAVQKDNPDAIRRLLRRPGIEVNVWPKDGENNLLTYAVVNSTYDTLKALLDAPGIDANARENRLLQTPLIALLAKVKNVRNETVELLIEKGADIRAKNMYGRTAIHFAIKKLSIVRLLAYPNESVLDDTTPKGYTVLMMAARSGTLDVFKYLIKRCDLFAYSISIPGYPIYNVFEALKDTGRQRVDSFTRVLQPAIDKKVTEYTADYLKIKRMLRSKVVKPNQLFEAADWWTARFTSFQQGRAAGTRLAAGTRVLARWKTNGNYYPGHVVGSYSLGPNPSTYDIQFDDGDTRDRTPFNEVMLEPPKIGFLHCWPAGNESSKAAYVRALLADGFDVNLKTSNGMSTLEIYCVDGKHSSVVRELLKRPDIDSTLDVGRFRNMLGRYKNTIETFTLNTADPISLSESISAPVRCLPCKHPYEMVSLGQQLKHGGSPQCAVCRQPIVHVEIMTKAQVDRWNAMQELESLNFDLPNGLSEEAKKLLSTQVKKANAFRHRQHTRSKITF